MPLAVVPARCIPSFSSTRTDGGVGGQASGNHACDPRLLEGPIDQRARGLVGITWLR
jgi:hypothetical protein